MEEWLSYFPTETYVIGTQNNRLNFHSFIAYFGCKNLKKLDTSFETPAKWKIKMMNKP